MGGARPDSDNCKAEKYNTAYFETEFKAVRSLNAEGKEKKQNGELSRNPLFLFSKLLATIFLLT